MTCDVPFDTLAAADYLVASLGARAAATVMLACRAGWLSPDEADMIEPFAVAIAHLLDSPVPPHRGRHATRKVDDE